MKRIGILLCCIVLCLLFPEKVHAEEIVSERNLLILFLLLIAAGP